jgi:hypothetical protein
MKASTVVKHAPIVVVATLAAGSVFCEILHPGLEPNPHVEQEAYDQGFTVRAPFSLSGNVAAQMNTYSSDSVVATQETLAHSIDAFVVRLTK